MRYTITTTDTHGTTSTHLDGTLPDILDYAHAYASGVANGLDDDAYALADATLARLHTADLAYQMGKTGQATITLTPTITITITDAAWAPF